MWSNKQKGVIHRYKAAANLHDQEYRAILHEATGRSSAADQRMTQYGFDWAMAFIEQRLHYRISEGFVARPQWLRTINYWRGRVARPGVSMSTRQRHEILEGWRKLTNYLPRGKWALRYPDDDPFWYLAGIASKAAGVAVVDVLNADDHVARLTIDALSEHLKQCLRHAQ